MKLTFSKNIQFTKLLKVNGRLKEFNFRKANDKPGGQFTVDVIDEYGGRIVFHMAFDQQWYIVETELPSWITDKTQDLHEIIVSES